MSTERRYFVARVVEGRERTSDIVGIFRFNALANDRLAALPQILGC
jgi:hypothetical protein